VGQEKNHHMGNFFPSAKKNGSEPRNTGDSQEHFHTNFFSKISTVRPGKFKQVVAIFKGKTHYIKRIEFFKKIETTTLQK